MRGSYGPHKDPRAVLAHFYIYSTFHFQPVFLIFFAVQNAVHSIGICLGAPHDIASVGCWMGTGF